MDKKMKILMLIFMSLLLSCSNPPPPPVSDMLRDPSDKWQNLEIGDKFKVERSDVNGVLTYNFYPMGFTNDMINNIIALKVIYFDDNESEVYHTRLDISPYFTEDVGNTWFDLYNYKDMNNITLLESQSTSQNYYKVVYNKADYNYTFSDEKIERTALTMVYTKDNKNYFFYVMKGLNNGSGELEVVGYNVEVHNENKAAIVESVGDVKPVKPL